MGNTDHSDFSIRVYTRKGACARKDFAQLLLQCMCATSQCDVHILTPFIAGWICL